LRDVVLIVVYRDDLCAREVTWENTWKWKMLS
jgi:hypothetical protein